MASRGPFLLSETYRNRGARTKHGIVLFAVVVALMALLIGVKGEKKDVDSHYGKNCTQQLHCGSQGLICMEGICKYAKIHLLLRSARRIETLLRKKQ